MPFTPFHMGPGILVKSILQGSFSLLVFGWAQIVMDIQPLVVLITGEGHLHGFTHTYIGATLIAIFSALSGKYLSEWGLKIIGAHTISIKWPIAFISAFIGSFSHVLLDSIMHSDIQPFFPFSLDNKLLNLVSVTTLHKICLYTGLIGALVYFGLNWFLKKNSKNNHESV